MLALTPKDLDALHGLNSSFVTDPDRYLFTVAGSPSLTSSLTSSVCCNLLMLAVERKAVAYQAPSP